LAFVLFRWHFGEISIAKVLLGTKPRHVRKFRRCWFSDVGESALKEKKETVRKIFIIVSMLSLS